MMKRVLSILLIGLFLFSMVGCGEKKNTKTEGNNTAIDWSTIELADKLPIPKLANGEISSESNSCIIVDFIDASQEDFEEYAAQCKKVDSRLTTLKPKIFLVDIMKTDITSVCISKKI